MSQRGPKPMLEAIEGGLSAVPPAPGWLSGEAKAEWRKVVPKLIERGVLADEDLSTVANYCTAVGQVQLCQAILSAEEPFVQSSRSAPRPHPAYKIMFAAMSLAKSLAGDLGLTPTSRNRAMKIEAKDTDDGWSDLLS